MRDLVKRRSLENGDQPTNKKMKEEPLDIKPDLRKVKQEMDEIEVIGEVKRTISSSLDNNNYARDINKDKPLSPMIIDRLMAIPRNKVGLVIGKKGANLNELRLRFPFVSIVLDTLDGNETGMDCPLYLRGTRDHTNSVIEMVSHKIGCFLPVYQSVPSYVIRYFKEITVTRAGIYSIDKSTLENEYHVTMLLSEEDDGPTRSIIINGNQLNVDLAMTKFESMMSESGNGMMTWRMRVPHYSVGRIIGARHANIIETRKKSGARCELSNAREGEDSSFRYFEVIGTRDQIEIADRMIRYFSGQYLDGSFLHTSYDSGFSSNTQSPRSMNSCNPSPISHAVPPSLPRNTPRFYG